MDRISRPFDGERARERTWTDEELVRIWRAADELAGLLGPYIRLLLLTGARRDELAGMRWSELDLSEGTWTLDASRHKGGKRTGQSRIFALPAVAIRILKSIPRIHGSDFVFPGRGVDGPMVPGSPLARRIRALTGIADWTFHDSRRTVATGLERLDVPPHIVEVMMGHAARGVTRRHYAKYTYVTEMQEAAEVWADHIAKLTSKGENVVGLRG